MVVIDEFKNEIEFFDRYPSGYYKCTNCGYMTISKYECPRCGFRADGLFKTMNKGYKYKIGNKEYETFIPIERRKL